MQLDEALVPPGTAFLYHEEVKQTVGPRRVLKVYLVDKDGRKHLAATGEDLGDAHYHYRSTKPFSKYGAIDCHNRKELTQWLEMIISETSNKEGPHLDVDEQNPEGVYFTAHKYERAHMSDGRRVNRWYLVDQHGSAHLAVIGVERDTKDGHYTYGAEEPFASRIPLQCSNQSGVFKWLEKWITHHAAGTGSPAGQANGQAASVTVSVGTATSGGGTSAVDAGTRNPPVFISLSAIRHARKSAAALLAASATLADPQVRAKAKSKQAAEAAAASGLHEAHTASAKTKSLSIVQQNQIKKARKLQEDAKAEQERLVSGHLARLRRAAAAELQGDNTAKQVAMSWLQGDLTPDELEALQHWVTLLSAVLDLQQQAVSSGMHELQGQGVQVGKQEGQLYKQQQQCGVQSLCDDPGAVQEQQEQTSQLPQQHHSQQDEQQRQLESQVLQSSQQQQQTQQLQLPLSSEVAESTQQQQQQQQQSTQHQQLQELCSNGAEQTQHQQQQHLQPPPPQQQRQQQDNGFSIPWQPAGPVGAGMTDKELLTWLQQPGNERHYMRVTLECLKEIGAVELPARALLGYKVVSLVRRCLAEHADESVRSLARHMLQRWRWQLAGHMQVLTQPAYMEDHLAALDEQVAAGLVPLPQLPQHKQVLLSTDIPSISGVISGRMQHTPTHSTNHYVQQRQQQQPQAGHTLPRKQAEAGAQAGAPAFGFGSVPQHNSHAGFTRLPQQFGYSMLNPGPSGTTASATPISALSGLYRAGSPALAAALGAQQSLLHAASGSMQSTLLGTGQHMSVFQYPDPAAAEEAFGLNHNATLLAWSLGSAGVPALSSVQLQAAGAPHVSPLPAEQQQQQQFLMQQSHFLGMPQQQQQQLASMQQQGLAGTTAASVGLQLSHGLLQQQQLALTQITAGMGHALQQQAAEGQQQSWLGFLQQPLAAQPDQLGAMQQLVWQGVSDAGPAS